MPFGTLDQNTNASLASSQNRVLRNAYLLLGISMLPTAAGAMLGIHFGFSFFRGSPLLSILAFLGISFGFFYGIERFKNSSVGVLLLLGFTFFMGLMLSRLLLAVLGFSNGASLIALASLGTGAIFVTMASIATVIKRDLSGLGKFLFIGVALVIVASIANVFLHLPLLSVVLSVACLGIFSVYILYDINKVITGGETNYITAALAIYLDVFNVFVSLLRLLAFFAGERD